MTRTLLCARTLALAGVLAPGLALAPGAATPLGAQAVEITPFAARSAGPLGGSGSGFEAGPGGGGAMMAGLGASWYPGPVGLRVSGSMDAASSPLAPVLGHPPSAGVEAWTGELDLVLSGARAGLRLGTIEPSVFAGVGVVGGRDGSGSMAAAPVWSWGGGAAVPLASWLALEAEARRRTAFDGPDGPAPLPAQLAGDWELRTGLSLRLGGRGRAGAVRARTPDGEVWTGGGSGRPGDAPVGATARAALTLRTADRYLGVPYVWGGNTPEEGFDCSGFVRYVYARNDVALPRVSRDQARAGTPLPLDFGVIREGDLLFFAGDDGVVSHVAIYTGNGRIIHAASSRGEVAYDDLNSRSARWYRTHLVGARRVLHGGLRFAPWAGR